MDNLKQLIKRSGFLIGLVRAVRGAVLDLKQLYWAAIRPGKVRAYFDAQPVRKLQIGTSNTPLAGWLNTDFILENPSVVYLDATRRFPFPDRVFDYVTCEHMIEHIDYASGETMLRECFRVLKPGGKIRLSTPDLRMITSLCAEPPTEPQKKYVDFIIERVMPEVKECKAVFVVNNAFRAWGHQFLYDPATLRQLLAKQGFENLREYKPGVSDDPNLRGLEAHGKAVGNEEMNQFETFVIEARTPQLPSRS
jgi:predicted SAM-dependent methyltransferase